MKQRAKKTARQIAEKLPVSRSYLKNRHLGERVRSQKDEIIGLRQSVDRLEKRNEEWAEEVRTLRGENTMHVLWPVRPEDLIAADYRQPLPERLAKKHKEPFTFNWVVPPVGSVSGGHAVIFHVVNFLEKQGHRCRIYFYDPMHQGSFAEIKKNLKNHDNISAELFYNEPNMEDCDAIFATGWSTAYPVFNFKGVGKKFYFMQDYESLFDVSGSYSTLAENTYKMGLQGLATSPWAASEAKQRYGMKSDVVELAVTQGEYSLTNVSAPRKKILFYARPVTPRRGFELGVLALEVFHKKYPEYEINFIGWDVSAFEIPFPYVNRGILSRLELNELYNECAAGLALSFTSMSLLPVEMMAAGCMPVVNDASYTRMVGYGEGIKYAEPSPSGIVDALIAAAQPKDMAIQAKWLSDYSKKFSWEKRTHVSLQSLSVNLVYKYR